MRALSDHDLLRRYVRHDDHDAFAELVRRYISLVHAAARRQTRDAHLADDVTQAVMIVLARRAGTIGGDSVLGSWLLVVTRHCAQNAMKMQVRRRLHERRAAAERAEMKRADQSRLTGSDEQIGNALHDAIAHLREADRAGVVLHYFQHRTHIEVAQTLGLTPAAARKRVERALEKMRQFLAGRGVVTTSAALIASIQAETSSAAAVPAGLASSTVNVALLSNSAQGASCAGSLAIAHAVTRTFALAKLKAAAAVLIVAAVAIPVAGVGAWMLTTVGSPAPLAAAASSEPPATQPDASPFSAQVTDNIRVQFLGVAPHPAEELQWHDIAGEPIDMPDSRLADNEVNTDSQPDQQIAILLTHPPGTQFGLRIDGSRTNSNDSNDDDKGTTLLRSRFALTEPAETCSLRLAFTTRPWHKVGEWEVSDQPIEHDAGKYGPIMIRPPHEDLRWGPGCVSVEHGPITNATARMIAIDDAGERHVQRLINGDSTNDEWVTTFVFDVPHDKIRKLILEARDYDKYLIAENISLSPDVKTSPKFSVVDAEK
jgi:RNA polymerase sigma factor (sigma-70 family)